MSRGFAVAFSGGRDSTALLHACVAAARALDLTVHALHVHHNLQPQADAWMHHARDLCRQWAGEGAPLQFHARVLQAAPPRGASVEAWAREQRLTALDGMARECGADLILLAHHQRDQAETFLLQALRSGGAAGLSAMPRLAWRDGIAWARPWLSQPREAVERYVAAYRLPFVDDPSNDDPRFARSRLRQAVWPALAAAFPQAEATLAGSAQLAQRARAALDELADADVTAITEGDALCLDRWQALSEARRAISLAAWIARHTGRSPPETLIRRLLDELPRRGPARWPLLPQAELRRWRDRLRIHRAAPAADPPPAMTLHIRRAGDHDIDPWAGTLRVVPVSERGVALSRLHRCELRPREGGEQFRVGPGRPLRRLKKQFQAGAVAPGGRDGPLVYCDGRLVFVPGLGIPADEWADPHVEQVALEWLPAEASFAAPQ